MEGSTTVHGYFRQKLRFFSFLGEYCLKGTHSNKYCTWNYFMTPTWSWWSKMKRPDESVIISAFSCMRNNKFLVTILWLCLNAWWHGFLLLLFGNLIPTFCFTCKSCHKNCSLKLTFKLLIKRFGVQYRWAFLLVVLFQLIRPAGSSKI